MGVGGRRLGVESRRSRGWRSESCRDPGAGGREVGGRAVEVERLEVGRLQVGGLHMEELEVGRLGGGRWVEMGGEEMVGGVGRLAVVMVVGGRWWRIGDGKERREEEGPWGSAVEDWRLEVGAWRLEGGRLEGGELGIRM